MRGRRDFFPLFISLEGKRICIAGAGKIAARRAALLLSFGAELFVTAPECCAEMQALLWGEAESGKDKKEGSQKRGVEGQEISGERPGEEALGKADDKKPVYRRRRFEEKDLQGMDLVLAATDDAALNHEIAVLCRKRKLPVNNASCKEDCDFFFPAVLQEDGLTIGVSSGGRDHKRVADTCERLRRFFRESL